MDKLAETLNQFAEKYGPTVSETVLAATRVSAYQTLTNAALGAVVGLLLAILAYYAWRKTKALNDDDNDACVLVGVVALAATIGSAMCFLISAIVLASPWTWAALSRPELLLAKKALGL